MSNLLILVIIVIQALGAFSNKAIADLGDANTSIESSKIKQTEFDAWCAKKNVDCLVKIEGDRLIVNEGIGISSNQLLQWSKNESYKDRLGLFIRPHYLYTYLLKYKTITGELKEGKIIFQNTKYSDSFYKQLQRWAPSKEYKCFYDFDSRKETC